MTAKLERNHPAEFIISEAEGTRSRDVVTVVVPQGFRLRSGRILGKRSGDGKYVACDGTATDGSEVPAGILYAEQGNVDGADDLEVEAVIVNTDAEVAGARLVRTSSEAEPYDVAVTVSQAVAEAALLALGIKVRFPAGEVWY